MRRAAVIFSLLAIVLAGCSSEPQHAPMAEDVKDKDNIKASDAKVVNSPEDIKGSSSGYRIEPKDPNDPRFKADPKLAGGG